MAIPDAQLLARLALAYCAAADAFEDAGMQGPGKDARADRFAAAETALRKAGRKLLDAVE